MAPAPRTPESHSTPAFSKKASSRPRKTSPKAAPKFVLPPPWIWIGC